MWLGLVISPGPLLSFKYFKHKTILNHIAPLVPLGAANFVQVAQNCRSFKILKIYTTGTFRLNTHTTSFNFENTSIMFNFTAFVCKCHSLSFLFYLLTYWIFYLIICLYLGISINWKCSFSHIYQFRFLWKYCVEKKLSRDKLEKMVMDDWLWFVLLKVPVTENRT